MSLVMRGLSPLVLEPAVMDGLSPPVLVEPAVMGAHNRRFKNRCLEPAVMTIFPLKKYIQISILQHLYSIYNI